MQEQDFTIESKDFDKLYNLAEIIIETRSVLSKEGGNSKNPPEVLAAIALQEQIEAAKEQGTDKLFLKENEVAFLSVVV